MTVLEILIAASETDLPSVDLALISDKLDSVITLLHMLIIVAGMIFGSCVFRHFRK